ncbi:unnamed protein product [Amaranthus hypochondriacus]
MGGGAMRAAAKIAGIGALSTGFRAEAPVNLASRNIVKPVSASLVSLTSTSGDLTTDQSFQKASWEFDEWEFAGSEDEFVIDKVNSGNPRLVFGPVPTIEETKQATSELKDALDKVYLSSPKSSVTVESSSNVQESNACITRDSSVPKSAMQAFKLLKESPAAQNVVASIACDPNVWNAVMQNPHLVEFLESEKNSAVPDSPKYHDQESWKTSVDSSDDNHSKEPDSLMNLFENVKEGLVDMVQYLTNLVQSWFSIPKVGPKNENDDDKSTQNYIAGGSFMALAMMVIMVVVLKR